MMPTFIVWFNRCLLSAGCGMFRPFLALLLALLQVAYAQNGLVAW
jgi:hypothetical protein